MRIFIVALMAALSLAGVLRLSRASVPNASAPALAAQPQEPVPQVSADNERPAPPPIAKTQQAFDATPTGTIPPEQPRLLKPKKRLVTPAMVPPPPHRNRAAKEHKPLSREAKARQRRSE